VTPAFISPRAHIPVLPRFQSFLRLKPYGVELTFSHYRPVVAVVRLDTLGGYANVFVYGTDVDLHFWKDRILVM